MFKTLIYLLQYRTKNKFIKKTLRRLKYIYFTGIDFIGSVAFGIARLLHLMPAIEKFSNDEVKKILVIKTNRIGDVILSTPTIRALRENFPEAFICFLTTPATKDLVVENKDIDEIMLYERDKPLYRKVRLIKTLGQYHFDLAIVMCLFFKSALIAYLSKAVFRVGYPSNGSGFLLTTKVDMKNRYKHEIETCMDIVRAIGIDTQDKRPSLPVSQAAEDFANRLFDAYKISSSDLVIGIHPGAVEEFRRWAVEGFAKVADTLINKYKAKVIFFGAKADRAIVKNILDLMREKSAITGPDTGIQQLAALIKRCDVFLGNLSGPIQIAAAVGTPVVAISGTIHPLDSEAKFAPPGDNHIIVRKEMGCVDCHPGHCRDYKCMELIKPEDVLNALETQIKRTGKSSITSSVK